MSVAQCINYVIHYFWVLLWYFQIIDVPDYGALFLVELLICDALILWVDFESPLIQAACEILPE